MVPGDSVVSDLAAPAGVEQHSAQGLEKGGV